MELLVVAGVLYGMEFVADKIPYVDSIWDAVSTLIRPAAGAVIAVLIAGDVSPWRKPSTRSSAAARLSRRTRSSPVSGSRSTPHRSR